MSPPGFDYVGQSDLRMRFPPIYFPPHYCNIFTLSLRSTTSILFCPSPIRMSSCPRSSATWITSSCELRRDAGEIQATALEMDAYGENRLPVPSFKTNARMQTSVLMVQLCLGALCASRCLRRSRTWLQALRVFPLWTVITCKTR